VFTTGFSLFRAQATTCLALKNTAINPAAYTIFALAIDEIVQLYK